MSGRRRERISGRRRTSPRLSGRRRVNQGWSGRHRANQWMRGRCRDTVIQQIHHLAMHCEHPRGGQYNKTSDLVTIINCNIIFYFIVD